MKPRGRPKNVVATCVVPLRLPGPMIDRCGKLVKRVAERSPEQVGMGRAGVMRLALSIGLEVLEEQYGLT